MALVLVLLILSSCGPRTLSPQAYQEFVISSLQGDTGEASQKSSSLPGLVPAVERLFASFYCAESVCTMPSELSYLSEVADFESSVVEEHRSRICEGKRKIRPPQELAADHEKICKLLAMIRSSIEAIQITSQVGAQLLAQSMGDPETLKRTAENYSRKIMEQKSRIVEALRQIQRIPWLKMIFNDTKIPELNEQGAGGGN